MKRNLRNNLLVISSVIALLGALYSQLQEKGDFVLLLNDLHTPLGNVFFKYVTHFGDGLALLILGVILLFVRFSNVLFLIIAAIIQTLVLNFFKKGIAELWPRPKTFFKDTDVTLQFVDGVHVHSIHSFPSGHTATAFTVAFLIVWFSKNNWLNTIAVILAFAVALSRVYLVQHFLVDVCCGALVGMGTVVLTNWIIKKTNLNRFDGSLLNR